MLPVSILAADGPVVLEQCPEGAGLRSTHEAPLHVTRQSVRGRSWLFILRNDDEVGLPAGRFTVALRHERRPWYVPLSSSSSRAYLQLPEPRLNSVRLLLPPPAPGCFAQRRRLVPSAQQQPPSRARAAPFWVTNQPPVLSETCSNRRPSQLSATRTSALRASSFLSLQPRRTVGDPDLRGTYFRAHVRTNECT